VKARTPKCVKPVPPTDPESVKLAVCDWCAGHGFEGDEENGLIPCLQCSGGGYEIARFDLGSTRSSPKGRPCSYNPGTRELVATVARKVTVYDVAELDCDTGFPGRGFEVVKRGTGEVRHCLINRNGQDHTCDCEGSTYLSAAKANQRAWEAGEETYPTAGCIHADAMLFLIRAGLVDLPAEVPPEVHPNPFD
jgi:hypothetical protein